MTRLITTRQAAECIGVPEARIRQWASRGVLTRFGRVGGVAYYWRQDVYRTEAAMRRRADQRRIVDSATSGCHSGA